jgi:hypothetical protein
MYEAILYSSHTDLGIFHAMRGEITIKEIIYEFNYVYKYVKEKWITERGVRKEGGKIARKLK